MKNIITNNKLYNNNFIFNILKKYNIYNNNNNNNFIFNLLKKYNIYNNNNKNISLYEIRLLICFLIENYEIENIKKLLYILFEYDNDSILKLLLCYKNKIKISKKKFKDIVPIKDKIDLFINFNFNDERVNWEYADIGENFSPLHLASLYYNLNAIDLLINYGADINIKNNKNRNSLLYIHKLAYNFNCTNTLIKYGINIHDVDIDGDNILHKLFKLTCAGVEKNYAEYFLKQKININKINKEGNTPLMELCNSSKWPELIPLLIKYGANISIRNNKGETAFFIACKVHNRALINMLKQNKANIHIRDNEGNTPLIIFSKYISIDRECLSYIDILDDLINYGLDLNATNNNGRTSLMEICKSEDEVLIEHYLKRGAYMYAKDNEGNTALSIAKSYNNYRIVNYLIEQGANWKFCNYSKNKKLI